jgi:hypothetical protein
MLSPHDRRVVSQFAFWEGLTRLARASCPVLCSPKSRQGAVKGFVVVSGTAVKETREWARFAAAALELVRAHMELRRPGVRIEDDRGNPISFFQLKDMAELESRKKRASVASTLSEARSLGSRGPSV